jgi:hypothetical protein
MKEPGEGRGFGVDARKVGAFVPVAETARERKVVERVIAAVLARDDVIDRKLEPRISLREQAVFTAVLGTITNFLFQLVIHRNSGGRAMLLERDPCLGLKDREQSVDSQEVVQLCAFLVAERAGLHLFG